MAMGPSAVFVVHHREGGERFNVLTPPLMPPIEWNLEVLEELNSLKAYESYEVDEDNNLITTYTDPLPETDFDREFDQMKEILARATGRDIAEVHFEPCSCMIAAAKRGAIVVVEVQIEDFPLFHPSMN
jgi:hypothetical protein